MISRFVEVCVCAEMIDDRRESLERERREDVSKR
jgi:hypothetical protein